MIGKNRIKQVNSNTIVDFVNEHLEAISYTRCCMELLNNHIPVDGGTSFESLGKTNG